MTLEVHDKTPADEFELDPSEPLYPTMILLMQIARQIAPGAHYAALRDKARQLQQTYRNGAAYKAEAKFMRVIQDGIDFGKWPS